MQFTQTTKPIIQCVGLKKNYLVGKILVKALQGIDLQVKSGEFLVLAGPSGSGKSTLLNLLGLIDSPNTGNLTFEDQDLSKTKENQLAKLRKKKIGFIFQNFNLVPVLNAYENVEFPLLLLNTRKKKKGKLIETYLGKVGLWERRGHKPSQLSGGEQQRVAIARALVKQPRLVIADEPTANLDSTTTHQVIKIMRELNRQEGITFIIASHDPIVIKKGRRVIHICDGKLTNQCEKNGGLHDI
jgi:putative ABC transport system ATP-binding protein